MDDFDMGLLDDETYKVSVLRQKMLGIAPVFMYRVPKEKGSGEEYLADEWNLRKPLQQCSLRVERRGGVLLIVYTFQKEGSYGSKLFALTAIDLENNERHRMDHYVQPVGDSSRYFAVRVTDEKSQREAVLGLGFREREEADDFIKVLKNYENSIARQKLQAAAHMAQQ